jgi:HSP20 family protein
MAWISDEELNKIFERMLRNIGLAPDDLNFESWSYGYSMTTGPDGKPIVQEWGTGLPNGPNPLKPQPYLPETPEPLSQVDINPENKQVRVIVEMPGFTKESMRITGTENQLQLSANSETRQVDTIIPIKARIDPKTAKATYKNGVLDITLKLLEVPQTDGVNIQVN